MRLEIVVSAILFISFAFPVAGWGLDEYTVRVGDAKPVEKEVEFWDLPGIGASSLAVNPSDGTIWAFFHQTRNLAALDPSDGEVLIDVPLTISPTAMAFSPNGRVVFLVGEPIGDMIISAGIVQAIDASDGSLLAQLEMEGACSALYVSEKGTIWVAAGLQYAYQGQVYELSFGESEAEEEEAGYEFEIVAQAACGKIPWAITERDGKLYVNDLELQWTTQPDGSMGPPYGAWVWVYEAETLEPLGQEWVGVNPDRLANTRAGVLVGCSGSKQTEDAYEPALALIRSPGDTDLIYVGTAGASDIAASPDGSWAVATLADWGPPNPWSGVVSLEENLAGIIPEARRWLYTGDVELLYFDNGEVWTYRVTVIASEESYLRAIAISRRGSVLYALQAEPERLLVVPLELLESDDWEPIMEEEEL